MDQVQNPNEEWINKPNIPTTATGSWWNQGKVECFAAWWAIPRNVSVTLGNCNSISPNPSNAKLCFRTEPHCRGRKENSHEFIVACFPTRHHSAVKMLSHINLQLLVVISPPTFLTSSEGNCSGDDQNRRHTTVQFPYLETCGVRKWGMTKEIGGASYEASTRVFVTRSQWETLVRNASAAVT